MKVQGIIFIDHDTIFPCKASILQSRWVFLLACSACDRCRFPHRLVPEKAGHLEFEVPHMNVAIVMADCPEKRVRSGQSAVVPGKSGVAEWPLTWKRAVASSGTLGSIPVEDEMTL